MKQGSWQSKETGFADLPKAIKLTMTVANSGSVGFTNALFNTTAMNYGPFVVRPNATPATFDAVVVQEPGVYSILAQFACLNGAGSTYTQIAVNGSGTLPDGSSAQNYVSVGGSNAITQVATVVELKAGDVVTLQYTQAVAVNTLANLVWLCVKKERG